MKKFLIALAALVLLGPAPALAAKGDSWAGLQFGASMPIGNFSSSAMPGVEGGAVGTYMLAEDVGVGVDVAYHLWEGSDEFARDLTGVGIINAIQTTAHVLRDFRTGGRVRGFAKGGLGVYWMRTRIVALVGNSVDETRPEFGCNVGAGVNVGHAIGIGGTYHLIQPGGSPVQFFTAAVNLGWGAR